MLRIERVRNPDLTTNNTDFRYGHPLYGRGLVDTLLESYENTFFYFTGNEVHKNIGKHILRSAEAQNIAIGKSFGVAGINILEMLSLPDEYNDVWFETNITNFKRLPKKYCISILKRFKFIIVEYIEGGTFIGNQIINPISEIENITKDFRQIVVATSGYHNVPQQGHNWFSISIPMYLIFCYSYMHQTQQETITYLPDKLAMLQVNKPRYNRLFVLSKLHEKNLLANCTWSCNINYDPRNKTLYGKQLTKEEITKIRSQRYKEVYAGDILDVDHADFSLIEKFKEDNRHQLPKPIPGLEFVKERILETAFYIIPDLIGKHHFHITIETDIESAVPETINKNKTFTDGFVSDKTFKSFFYCNPTLLLGDHGSIDYCRRLGFIFPEKSLYLDANNLHDSVDCILDILTSPINEEENKFCAENNYKKVFDKDFLSSLVLDELNKLKK